MCFQSWILMKNERSFAKMAQELEVAGMGEGRDTAQGWKGGNGTL